MEARLATIRCYSLPPCLFLIYKTKAIKISLLQGTSVFIYVLAEKRNILGRSSLPRGVGTLLFGQDAGVHTVLYGTDQAGDVHSAFVYSRSRLHSFRKAALDSPGARESRKGWRRQIDPVAT